MEKLLYLLKEQEITFKLYNTGNIFCTFRNIMYCDKDINKLIDKIYISTLLVDDADLNTIPSLGQIRE